MTVIAAVRDPGTNRTYIGSDTIAVNGGTIMPNGPKWVRRGDWAVGQAGDKLTFNIIQAHADSIFYNPPGAWAVAMRIRDLLIEYGFQGNGENGPQDYGQNMIIAHPGGVWSVADNFGLVEVPDGEVWADGCGRTYGLGAAHAAAAAGKGPREQVETAIAAACRYDNDCGGEPWIDVLGAQNATINFGGPVSKEFAQDLTDFMRDAIDSADMTIIAPGSRQARELREDDDE